MGSRQGTLRKTHARLGAALLAAVLVAAGAPSVASAGTVGLNGGELSFVADDGQANTITVTGGNGQITVRDAGNDVLLLPFTDAQSQCTHPTTDSATCPATSIDVDAGDLADTVDASSSSIAGPPGIGAVFLNGGDGSDRIIGGPTTDTISGDSGGDSLEGRGGDDFLSGGDGNDSLSGGDGNDSLETITFATLGDDTIDGGAGDDTLVQTLRPVSSMSDGADTFNGGPGTDTANYAGSDGSLALSLDGQANDGYANEGDNLGTDVENLVGGPSPDIIVGSESANSIDAGPGDDVVRGMGGDDQLQGGSDAGSDTLDGGDGADRVVGGAGDDQLVGGSGDDSIDGSGGTDTEQGGDGADQVAGGAGIDTISGGEGDDTLRGADSSGVGADGADTISGGGGTDRISGDDGNDTLDGGSGPDLLSGGLGKDTADYSADTKSVSITIDDVPNDGVKGEADNVTSDIEDVKGGNFESSVVGTAGSNTLAGGNGEDFEDGAAGSDQLDSGPAGDTVRSRDGVADVVDCGAGPDFAIADPMDDVKSTCERVDRGRSKPVSGRTFLAKPAGTNLLKRPGIHRFVPLMDSVGLPVGSTLDPIGTHMTLVTAARGGKRQSGVFSGGAFTVKQARGALVTELQLTGGDPLSKCGLNRVSAAASHHVRRRLFGNAHGHFTTRGRYSSATVRGTRWSLEDRCDGTLTRVKRGSVVVRDFARHRKITVRAGHSYLARAPRRG